MYIESLLPAGTLDPMEFWHARKPQYPFLSKIALKYLMLPASSAASERIVSSLNLVLDKKRNRLTERNIDNLVFLHGLDITIWNKIMVK